MGNIGCPTPDGQTEKLAELMREFIGRQRKYESLQKNLSQFRNNEVAEVLKKLHTLIDFESKLIFLTFRINGLNDKIKKMNKGEKKGVIRDQKLKL